MLLRFFAAPYYNVASSIRSLDLSLSLSLSVFVTPRSSPHQPLRDPYSIFRRRCMCTARMYVHARIRDTYAARREDGIRE